MLNTTNVLRHIEKELGYKFSQLEITHDEILDLLKLETLTTFSKYFPYQGDLIVIEPIKDLVPGTSNIFYIDSETEILNINKLVPNSILGPYLNTSEVGVSIANSLYSNPISRQLDKDLISAVTNPTTFRFIYPNKVEITPAALASNTFAIMVNRVHPDHFGTIPGLLRDEFLELAVCDVKIMLYKIRTRFQNISSTFGELSLFIDDLQNAKDERKDLLDKFRTNVLKNPNRKKIIIA